MRSVTDHGTDKQSGQRDPALEETFERTVEEGERRLSRTWPMLVSTGLVGGIDVSIGVFGLLVVRAETKSVLLSALAFGIGFIALTLANSELFTENFLVPLAAVIAHRSRPRSLVRLWIGTALANLVGGWVVTGIIMTALPGLGQVAVDIARVYPDLGLGWRSFALAVLGGMVITLMTWMEKGSTDMAGKLVAAVSASFLLAAGTLNHAIVVSLELFAALHSGAPFGYADWLGVFLWASLGNLVGGIGLVSLLRLVQVGAAKVVEERNRS